MSNSEAARLLLVNAKVHEHAGYDRPIQRLDMRGRRPSVAVSPEIAQFATVRLPLSSDELERRLNGEVVSCFAQSWRIDVYGIVDADGQRWVQVGLDGVDQRSLLLKLACVADDADIVNALERWLGSSISLHGGILPVSCLIAPPRARH